MTIYAYARVSGQIQNLELQIEQLKEHKAERIYSEKFTGTKKNRPEFTKLLEIIESGDTLIVTKLDRFARTATDAIELIRELHAKGVTVTVLNMGTFDNTPQGKMMLTMMAGFAEFERDMIVSRMQEGKDAAKAKAKARGERFSEGRPRTFTEVQLQHAVGMLGEHSYTQVSAKTGISKSTLIREVRKRKESK
jgi:DNA invertase Pin-like site-specific DNA recombinase